MPRVVGKGGPGIKSGVNIIVLSSCIRIYKHDAEGVIFLCEEQFRIERLLLYGSCSSKNDLYILPFAVLNLC